MPIRDFINAAGVGGLRGPGDPRLTLLVGDDWDRSTELHFSIDRIGTGGHLRGGVPSAAPTGHGDSSEVSEIAAAVRTSHIGDDAMAGTVGENYYIEGAGVTLPAGGSTGIDTVRTTVDFTLPTSVEDGFIEGLTGRTLYGNDLDNHLIGDRGDDTIFAGDGNDLVKGGDGNDYLGGEAGNDTLVGGDGNDYMFGDEGNDELSGGPGNDYLQGFSGDDHLDGGSGDDFLAGGPGADTLVGGAGHDTFYFYDFSESTRAAPDRITDFTTAASHGDFDQLDLSAIDANTARTGDQAFTGLVWGPTAHSLWISAMSTNPDGSVAFTLCGDVNGDKTPDFALVLHATAGFSAADILM